MAKLVYAMDLKSIGRNSPCRFESGSRHQQIVRDVLDPNRIAQCVRPGARRGMSMPQPANDHFVPAACTTRPSYDAQQQNPARTERLEQQSLAVNVVSALHVVCSKVSQCRRKAWIALDCRPESAALGLGLAQLSPGIRQFVIGVGAPPRHDSALKRVSGQQPVAAFNVQVSETQMSLVPGYGSRVDFENPFQLLPGLLRPSRDRCSAARSSRGRESRSDGNRLRKSGHRLVMPAPHTACGSSSTASPAPTATARHVTHTQQMR